MERLTGHVVYSGSLGEDNTMEKRDYNNVFAIWSGTERLIKYEVLRDTCVCVPVCMPRDF